MAFCRPIPPPPASAPPPPQSSPCQGQAARLGLRAGDELLAVDGDVIPSPPAEDWGLGEEGGGVWGGEVRRG